MRKELNMSVRELAGLLFREDEKINSIFTSSSDLAELRKKLFDHLSDLERNYFGASHRLSDKKHIMEEKNARRCIRVFKNIISPENEKLSGFSALDRLFKIHGGDEKVIAETAQGFVMEFLFMVRGINGNFHLSNTPVLSAEEITAESRGRVLDDYSEQMLDGFARFRKGTDPKSVDNQKVIKQKILEHFSASKEDWTDYKWHMSHIIRDYDTLSKLVHLEDDEIEGIMEAKEKGIPFQITPYYLTLFNISGRDEHDRLVRAQVMPSREYCRNVVDNRTLGLDMDFMGEQSTSPFPGITRRYPGIVILKPFDSCPQICVYCQRNWEIKNLQDTVTPAEGVDKAIDWIRKNRSITEVLVTGGDPLALSNDYIDQILAKISGIEHIERIRIGTRVIVTLPFRIDDELVRIFERYNRIGEKELCIVTHFEDASEITPDTLEAVKKIRRAGISIYNQQVFTYFNSFRYRTCFLRKILKLSGIDPYYSFNTKGKEETVDFRVPIARIEQERTEEARLLPGMVRTDEPVFNVPKLGKSHLRSWQNHEVIMIFADGSRGYRFFPWESMLHLVEDYLYRDVPINKYLKRIEKDGEDPEKYESIWYYF